MINDDLYLICKIYRYSPQSTHELKSVSEELETRFYKPAPVKCSRWIPHLNTAIQVFLKGIPGADLWKILPIMLLAAPLHTRPRKEGDQRHGGPPVCFVLPLSG